MECKEKGMKMGIVRKELACKLETDQMIKSKRQKE